MQHFPAYTWILYTPDCCQKYGADKEEYVDDWMHFAPDDEDEALLRELQIPLNTAVTLPKGTEISKIIRSMYTEFYSTHLHRSEMTNHCFRILLYRLHEQLVRIKAVTETESLTDRLRWIKEFIYRKPFDNFTAARFAEELNITVDAFRAQYSAHNGSGFEDDLIATRMHYISEQMRLHLLDNQTVEEIAQLCGYECEEEFAELFSRSFGKSPQAYLDELRG